MSCHGVYTFSKLGMVWQGWEGLKRSVSSHVALAGCVGPVAEVTTSGAPCEAIRLGWSACHTIPPVSRSSLRCNSKLPGINYMNLQGVQTLVPWRGIPFTLQKTNIHNYRLDDTEQKNHLQILIVFRGNHWFPYLGFSACANRPVDLALMVTPGSVVNTHLIIFMRSPSKSVQKQRNLGCDQQGCIRHELPRMMSLFHYSQIQSV